MLPATPSSPSSTSSNEADGYPAPHRARNEPPESKGRPSTGKPGGTTTTAPWRIGTALVGTERLALIDLISFFLDLN